MKENEVHNGECTECDVAQDLLPLYIANKVGAESRYFVEAHLKKCQSCRESYRYMSADIEAGFAQESGNGKGKGEKGKNRHKKAGGKRFVPTKWKLAAMAAVGILAYIGLMIGVVVGVFFYLTN